MIRLHFKSYPDVADRLLNDQLDLENCLPGFNENQFNS